MYNACELVSRTVDNGISLLIIQLKCYEFEVVIVSRLLCQERRLRWVTLCHLIIVLLHDIHPISSIVSLAVSGRLLMLGLQVKCCALYVIPMLNSPVHFHCY